MTQSNEPTTAARIAEKTIELWEADRAVDAAHPNGGTWNSIAYLNHVRDHGADLAREVRRLVGAMEAISKLPYGSHVRIATEALAPYRSGR